MNFEGHYGNWRRVRIEKILNIFSKDFFNNKTIVEFGCGYGDNGAEFEKLGAKVTYYEGRQQNIDDAKFKYPTREIQLLDQSLDWDIKENWDIAIHWGLLYHIDNWKGDLEKVFKCADVIFLESEVCDSDDKNFEIKVEEDSNWYDQSLINVGSRPSAAMIEEFILKNNMKFTRYDDSDLNSDFHTYDWTVTNTNTYRNGLRRFWVIQKNI
jgi:hypothetical protein